MVKNAAWTSRIGKRNAFEDKAIPDWPRRRDCVWLGRNRRLDLKEFHEIREKQGLVGDTREGRENSLNIVARAGDGAGKELQGSPTQISRYRSVDDVSKGPIVARCTQKG